MTSDKGMRIETGRWVRREDGIEVWLDRSRVNASTGLRDREVTGAEPPFTSRDVINARIDPCAQFSLLRLRDAGGGARADAVGLLEAVQSGALAGIYGSNLLAAVKLAQKLGTVWWELLPQGEDGVLVVDPTAPLGPPTVVFRAIQTAGPQQKCLDRNRLDPALRKAWQNFQIFRSNKLVRCNTLPKPVSAEAGFSAPVAIAGIIPPFCARPRVRTEGTPTAAPVLVRSSTAVFLGIPPDTTVDGFFCPCIRQAGFSWSIECQLLFPKGSEGGTWRVGFVQNMISDEFEATYQGAPTKRYRINTPLVDFNEQDAIRHGLQSTIPFVLTQKIRSPDGNVIPFSNPVFVRELSGTPTTETFQLAYADMPSFAIDPKLNGDPKSPLLSVTRRVRFRAFLVSMLTDFPKGARPLVRRTVVHAVSEIFGVRTSVRFSKEGTFQVLFNTTEPQPPAPVPKLIARSGAVPVISGTTANDASRARFTALGISQHPACRGSCANPARGSSQKG